ncbi:hypothetical protein G7Y89_g4775 [Cudoniella acicularis]|uniref:Laccase n=1 Tax=Cudoniella acicularis TaxID=354080 RepID=A0A8H4RNR5_9HELO|nr:hypothetical protein G7Y89_g4775 [Cudoniella acicularis]
MKDGNTDATAASMDTQPKARRSLDDASTSSPRAVEFRPSTELLADSSGFSEYKNGAHAATGNEERRASYSDGSRNLRSIGIAFAIFLVTVCSISSFSKLIRVPSRSSAISWASEVPGAEPSMLGIELHPFDHVFRTPKTITYNWTITSGYRYPDGVKKQVYLVNGAFPGPTIECRSGDRLRVHVTNALPSKEGISLHWHGLYMRNFNNMDGAVGFTQCPIPQGESFTYDFEVDNHQSGTFWWHSHSQVQRGDGLYGGLVVHKPKYPKSNVRGHEYEKDILLLIGDWYHQSAGDVLSWYMSVRGFGNEPVPDSLLINGKGRFLCSMAVPARPVECIDILAQDTLGIFPASSQVPPTRLRIVNVGSLAGFSLGLSSGTLRPLALDGGFPIDGLPTKSVGIIYPGERLDLLLRTEKSTDLSSSLTINLDQENFKYPNSALRPNQSFPIFAAGVEWGGNDTSEVDRTSYADLSNAVAAQMSTNKYPFLEEANQTILLYTKTQKLSINSNHPMGFINRTSWTPQSTPRFPLISLPRSQWDENQLVPWLPTNPESDYWVDIVINNLDDGAHPFHLHGHDFYLLASHRADHGWGVTPPTRNPDPPPSSPH